MDFSRWKLKLSAKCSAAGMDKSQNKTPSECRRRNEDSFEQSRGIVVVPIVVEPVVVPVPRTVVEVQVADVQVVGLRIAVA